MKIVRSVTADAATSATTSYAGIAAGLFRLNRTGRSTATTARSVYGACIWTTRPATACPRAPARWSRSPSGFDPTASGRSSTAAKAAAYFARIASPATTALGRCCRWQRDRSRSRRFRWMFDISICAWFAQKESTMTAKLDQLRSPARGLAILTDHNRAMRNRERRI